MLQDQQKKASTAAGPQARREPEFPPEFRAEAIMAMDSAQLAKLLKDPQATEFQKAKACMRAAQVGGKDVVPALAALLGHEKMSAYARFGLAPIPDPSVDEALRAAMRKLKGRLLVGLIGTLGQRRDAASADFLAKLLHEADAEVAQAAAAALGVIGGPRAAALLKEGLARTKGPVRTEVAAAGLVCAEGLLATGERQQALALLDTLGRPDIPKPVRVAAMQATIEAETGLRRPR